jgi:uncharacterized OB-fold protein
MSDVNVVARWRERSTLLGRDGWQCSACQQRSLVARRLCAGCGAEASMVRAAMPRRGRVAAACLAGAAVEHLDQVTGRKAALLVELDGGGRIACLLAQTDAVSLWPSIHDQPVRLTVRRMALGPIDEAEPIPYGLKAALDLETRAALKAAAAGDAGTKQE